MSQDKHDKSNSHQSKGRSDEPSQQEKTADKQPVDKPKAPAGHASTPSTTASTPKPERSGKTDQTARAKSGANQAERTAGASKKASRPASASHSHAARAGHETRQSAPGATKADSQSAGKARPAAGGAGSSGQNPPGASTNDKNHKKRAGGYPLSLILAIAALAVAIIAIVLSIFVGYQGRQQLKDVSSQVDSFAEGHDSSLSIIQDQARQLDSRTSDLAASADQTQDDMAALKDQVDHLQVQQRQLSDQLGGNHERFVEQRIELLLEAANQQIQIAADPEAARRALELADTAIKNSGNPELHPVRDRIADELGDLKALPHPDIEGLSLKLAKAIRQVPDLPLKSDMPSSYEADANEEETDGEDAADKDNHEAQGKADQLKAKWRQLTDSVSTGLSRMITVRRANGTADEPALMAPDQSYFLVQNIQLQLRTARLALINGEEQTYQDALDEAQDWIKKYFDENSSQVTGLMSDLSALADEELAWEAPDLSGSLKELRQIMARNDEMAATSEKDQDEADDSHASSADETDTEEKEQTSDAAEDDVEEEKTDSATQDQQSHDDSDDADADGADDHAEDDDSSSDEDSDDEQDQDSDAEQADGRT